MFYRARNPQFHQTFSKLGMWMHLPILQ
jgi:hypothetical protein